MDNKNKENLSDLINISKKILKVFYILIIVIGAYVLLKILKELKIFNIFITVIKILAPLFLGIVVAWLLNPFVKWLEKKNVRRSIGVTLSYVILIGCIALLIKSIIPILYNQVVDLVDNLPNVFLDVKDWINNLFTNFESNIINAETIEKSLFLKLDEFSSNLSTTLPSFIINSLTSIASSIGSFAIGLVIGFFLLLSCNNVGNTVLEVLPKRLRKGTLELCTQINHSLRNYVNGAFLDALLVFIVSTIAFWVLGLKAPLLFGLFCGLMNVIPYAGPYIGGAPAVIVGFSQSAGVGIAVLIAVVIIQTIEGNVLQTLIISKTTKLHPVTIIIGLLVFGHFFGILGMLLSTPIIGVIKVIFNYFDKKYDLLSFD